MSYDYYLWKKPPLCPKWIGRIRAMLGRSGTIGHDAAIQEQLAALFPQLRWETVELKVRLPGPPRKATLLCAGPAPEFRLDAAPDGQVTSFVMSRAERAEVRRVEKKLGVVAMDMQAEGFLGMIFRG